MMSEFTAEQLSYLSRVINRALDPIRRQNEALAAQVREVCDVLEMPEADAPEIDEDDDGIDA